MATKSLTTSRRALLGALALAPALTTPVMASAMPADAEWSAAVAAYEAAVAACRQYNHHTLEPAERKCERLRAQIDGYVNVSTDERLAGEWDKLDALENRYYELVELVTKAAERIMATPAPNMLALARKIAIAREEWRDREMTDEIIARFQTDALRLGARA